MSSDTFCPEVVVFGSCMIDLVCYSPRLPKPGETIHGTDFKMGNGGKGGNQCVAAAKLGASAALIARVGDDTFGSSYIDSLKSLKVNVEHVHKTGGVSSGMAQITVSEAGENVIVVVPGANNFLSSDDAQRAQNLLTEAKVVIFQFEIPLKSTLAALKIVKKEGVGCTIVNAAPALRDIDPQIYTLSDIFCVNESEAEELTGVKVSSPSEAMKAIQSLLSRGCKTVIVTLGKDGAVFSDGSGPVQHVPAPQVTPLDTTGAGDAFIGALAFFTARQPKSPLSERISKSCQIASVSVQTKGTQSSFPFQKDLPQNLFSDR